MNERAQRRGIIKYRASSSETEMIDAVAGYLGLSRSGALRLLVARAARALEILSSNDDIQGSFNDVRQPE